MDIPVLSSEATLFFVYFYNPNIVKGYLDFACLSAPPPVHPSFNMSIKVLHCFCCLLLFPISEEGNDFLLRAVNILQWEKARIDKNSDLQVREGIEENAKVIFLISQ